MKYLAATFLVIVILGALPVVNVSYGVNSGEPMGTHALAAIGEKVIRGVPYVWQEINGLCQWATVSIVLQYLGLHLDLHDVLALTGVGFSFAYVRYNDTLLMFPGALYQQVEPTEFLADLYGVNQTVYLGSGIPGVDSEVQYLNSEGINVALLSSQEEAMQLMKNVIDEGYPLIVSVDPRWLPEHDYDILRAQNSSGGAHGVVIVGYNDTEGAATMIDPGVGSFGVNFSYPIDGRGNYTKISYTSLGLAWGSREWISVLLRPGGTPVEDVPSHLGPYVREQTVRQFFLVCSGESIRVHLGVR